MMTIIILFVAFALVVGVIAGVKTFQESKAQTSSMLQSDAFSEIANYIFRSGRPSQIIITLNNEIFYGPISGQFHQVPGNMIPPMDHIQRYSLAGAFEKKYNYRFTPCFDSQGRNLGTCQTGNGYIDNNADALLTGSSAAGSW